MTEHSGISMYRLGQLEDNQKALEKLKTNKLKGLAVCKASSLKELGLSFLSSSDTNSHLSVRCNSCDLSSNYPNLCKPKADGCGFDIQFENDILSDVLKPFEVLIPADPNRKLALNKLKTEITNKQIKLSEALEQISILAEDRLSKAQQVWLNGERNCYVVAETPAKDLPADFRSGAPSGFIIDVEKAAADAGLPKYRLMKGRTYWKGPISGIWQEITHQDFGRIPHTEIQSIKLLEEHVLPKYIGDEKAGSIAIINGLETKRVFEKHEFEAVLGHTESELLELIDRFLGE